MELFPGSDKVVPCPLCGKNAKQTIIGDHFKCLSCYHIFNLDSSDIGVDCFCDNCHSRLTDISKRVKKKVKKVKKISL